MAFAKVRQFKDSGFLENGLVTGYPQAGDERLVMSDGITSMVLSVT